MGFVECINVLVSVCVSIRDLDFPHIVLGLLFVYNGSVMRYLMSFEIHCTIPLVH